MRTTTTPGRAGGAAQPAPAAGTVSVAQAEKLLDLSGERLRQLARGGHIPAANQGRYPLAAIVHGYVKYLRDASRAGAKTQAEGRVRDARAREIELRIAEREASLIDLGEHDEIIGELVNIFAAEAAKLPQRFAHDAALHQRMTAEIQHTINRMTRRAARRSAELNSRVHQEIEE